MPIRVAVDAMGGDYAPAATVEGAVRASADVEVLLVGRGSELESELARHGEVSGVEIVDTPDMIGMDESPATAVKSKPKSSIHVGLGLHREGKADAFVSAGNTGAVMAASLFLLGRIEGVSRPAVIGYFPSPSGVSIVLDVGSNIDCKPEHLHQFARMGAAYAGAVMGKEHPSVALLNVGEEPGKGNELVKAAYTLLSGDSTLNFKGNIEGRDILMNAADVVVCDGFVGNVLLKFGESVASVLPTMLGAAVKQLGIAEQGGGMFRDVLSAVKKQFDYEEFGGAPLLGIKGTVLIGHGGSSARAVERMIRTAAEAASRDVEGAIARAMSA